MAGTSVLDVDGFRHGTDRALPEWLTCCGSIPLTANGLLIFVNGITHMAFARNIFRAKKDASKYGKRHQTGVMNKTESDFAELLQIKKLSGEILEWRFESKSFKLAIGTTYTPDFEVIYADGSKEYVDAKGGGPIDPKSVVKIKVAAEKWWEYRFVIEQKLSKKDAAIHGAPWKRTEY